MEIIKYECKPEQLRSSIYDVLVFISEENKSVMEQIRTLTYDPEFSEYNQYIFFPVYRPKWRGTVDTPNNLRTLVASADVLLRALPSSTNNDLFVAGIFSNTDDFESIKRELKEFVVKAHEVTSQNYNSYLAEQIKLGNEDLLSVFDEEQLTRVHGYIDKVKSGDMSYEYAGEQIDGLLDLEHQIALSYGVAATIDRNNAQFDIPIEKLIRQDIDLLLKDFLSASNFPKYKIVVLKRSGGMDGGVLGLYDVFLKRNGVMDKQKMIFSYRHAKALYIYFLIHASEKFDKEQIDKEQLIRIYHEIYGVSHEFSKRLYGNKIIKSEDEDIDGKIEKRFDKFMTSTKPSVNRTVLAALKGVYDHKLMNNEENKKKPLRDAEKWYTIQSESVKVVKNKSQEDESIDNVTLYYLDLPKDCVEIPESLLNV